MNAVLKQVDSQMVDVTAAVEEACARIAPSWPLDQMIAVNPYWGFVDKPIQQAADDLAHLCGARMLMPRAWYRQQWQAGRLRAEHLQRAMAQSGSRLSLAQLLAALDGKSHTPPQMSLVSDVVDSGRDTLHHMSWRDYITHSISQYCAAFFDHGQARWAPPFRGELYQGWLAHTRRDHGPRLLMGLHGVGKALDRLPDSPLELIAEAVRELGVPQSRWTDYFTALLLSINGWASWCAFQRWQSGLSGGDDTHLENLLATRLAWEVVLMRQSQDPESSRKWQEAMADWPVSGELAGTHAETDWLLQRAMEISYQEAVGAGLIQTPGPELRRGRSAAVQAVFCIDVRSEVFRRALEKTADSVETLGFAGFFGLPIEYQPFASGMRRPQLPGLLAPEWTVVDHCNDAEDLAFQRRLRLGLQQTWSDFRRTAASGFSFVETAGFAYALKLVKASLGLQARASQAHAGLSREDSSRLRPHLAYRTESRAPITTADGVALAARILRAMSLTREFARVVLLVGHGSESTNNPHAAGLDCGACCGQTGEVNARVLAALLNEPEIREGLNDAEGIRIPEETRFVAALHNTTTDEVTLFDLDDIPATHQDETALLRQQLTEAGRRARAERAGMLGLRDAGNAEQQRAVQARARDWSQVRPEWGLTNNAAFIVAPRARTRHMDLAGRAFLHDYRWREDSGFSTLELIMTAPMIVTHWINMQYYASTVDNERFGSGNKVLHNVVGSNIGVFEGNGGDLRIGLPMQSLHDGRDWVHTPLRLSVYIEAPRDAITAVIAKHDLVRELVDHGWLHLFQLDPDEPLVCRYDSGEWRPETHHDIAKDDQ